MDALVLDEQDVASRIARRRRFAEPRTGRGRSRRALRHRDAADRQVFQGVGRDVCRGRKDKGAPGRDDEAERAPGAEDRFDFDEASV